MQKQMLFLLNIRAKVKFYAGESTAASKFYEYLLL